MPRLRGEREGRGRAGVGQGGGLSGPFMCFFIFFYFRRADREASALTWMSEIAVGGLMLAEWLFHASSSRQIGLIMIQHPVFSLAPSLHHLVSISRRRGFGINCTCQVELGSQGVMAAQRPHAASPESAENYSTTCQFYCVVITESHRQTLTIHCLLWWCGGVNLRSGEISPSSSSQFNTRSCAFIARAGNCLSRCVSL